jgi:hypothetical protein
MSIIRKIMFGFIAVAAIPAFFFLTLELVLKWVGPGKSFDYFNTIEIDGEDYFQDNPYFIEQFYPASLDITPLENTFAAEAGRRRPKDLCARWIGSERLPQSGSRLFPPIVGIT